MTSSDMRALHMHGFRPSWGHTWPLPPNIATSPCTLASLHPPVAAANTIASLMDVGLLNSRSRLPASSSCSTQHSTARHGHHSTASCSTRLHSTTYSSLYDVAVCTQHSTAWCKQAQLHAVLGQAQHSKSNGRMESQSLHPESH